MPVSIAASNPVRERRYKLFQPAEMRVLDVRLKVHILNVSRTGLLACSQTPPPCDAIPIFDLGMVVRRGRVVWVKGDRLGVAFCVPLDDGDLHALVPGAQDGSAETRLPNVGLRRMAERLMERTSLR